MKNRLGQTLAGLLATVLLTVPALAASFPDVDDAADYAEAAEYLHDLGIMVGDDLGNFNPNKTVTRAEMATIICRVLDMTDNLPTDDQFSDVPTHHWANAYITKAAELGIVNGYGGGRFGPSDGVTYEQAITMVVRAVGLDEEARDMGGYPNGYLEVADDYGYSDGVVAHDDEPLKRWQVAIILYNVYV